jgi:hypothetical protein
MAKGRNKAGVEAVNCTGYPVVLMAARINGSSVINPYTIKESAIQQVKRFRSNKSMRLLWI